MMLFLTLVTTCRKSLLIRAGARKSLRDPTALDDERPTKSKVDRQDPQSQP